MEEKEKERLLKTLDRRTLLWEGKRDDAKRRLQGTEKAIAKIDLQVAEDTLKRIEARKKEILGETIKTKTTEPSKPEDIASPVAARKTPEAKEEKRYPKHVIR